MYTSGIPSSLWVGALSKAFLNFYCTAVKTFDIQTCWCDSREKEEECVVLLLEAYIKGRESSPSKGSDWHISLSFQQEKGT